MVRHLAIARERRRHSVAAAATFLLLFAAFTSPAAAQCTNTAPASNTTVTCSGSSSTPVVAATGSTGVTIDVVAGASVSAVHNTAISFPLLSVDRNSTITNEGTLSLSGGAGSGTNRGAAMLGATNGNALINAAGATITTTGAFNDGMAANGSSNTLTNNGTITTAGPNAYGMSAAWGQTNSGQTSNTLINTGAVSTSGSNARAASILGGSGTINNSGTLSASGTASNAAYLQGNNDQFINSGTVAVTGTGANAVFSNTVGSTFTATIQNLAGGQISSQTGSAIVTLNGNTTIINAGIVQSGAGTAITMGNGNDSLVLQTGSNIIGTANGGGGSNTVTLQGTGTASNQFVNFQSLVMQGAAWTWAGSGAFTSALVQSGTLEVDGSIAASSGLTVNAGATLSGTGTVGSTTINTGGTLAPGNAANPTGTLTVAGNLALQSGAIYLVQVASSVASSTNVSGMATLGGATVNAAFANGGYISRQYTIVTAAGGVSGGFASAVANTNLPRNFSDSLSYDATHAYLNLTLNFTPSPTSPTTPTPATGPGFGNGLSLNQQAVGNALINFFNTTGSIPLIYGTLNAAGLTQASGELATGGQQSTFDAMNLFLGLLTDPCMSRSGGADEAGATPGMTVCVGEGDAGTYAAIRNTDAYAMFTKAPPVAPFEQRWSVWSVGFGGSQTTDGNATVGSNTATSSIYGTAVGADYRISPFTVAGFALAGGGTNFSVANSGFGHSDLFQAGGFIRHTVGPAYISAALAYGWQDITTNRTVTVAGTDQLRAQFDANAFSGRLEGGYRFVAPWIGGIGITPYGAAQFTTFDLPAYAEQAIGGSNTFALAYNAKDVTDSRSELGIRTDKSFAMADGILTLRGRVAWAHDYDPDRSIAATFQALPGASFVVNGAAQASDSALVTASVEKKWLNGWSAAATFEGEFSDVTRAYAGKGVVRYVW
jgi:uncharacterized protein with beta-barrel porin domain